MNRWLDDPRVLQAQADALEGERARKTGDHVNRRKFFRHAANAFADVVQEVPVEDEETRALLARAALVCYASAYNPVSMLGVIRTWIATPRPGASGAPTTGPKEP